MYRDLLARAAEVIHEGLVIADAVAPDQPIIYANRAFLEITGYSLSEIIGRNCRFLQAHDKDQHVVKAIRDGLENSRPVDVTIRNYTKSGLLFWNELSIAPILVDGVTTHFVGVVADITIQRAAQKQQRLLEEHAQNTQRLEALGTLASGIAHDVNNSLVPITALGRLLRQRLTDGSEEADYVDQIVQAGERIRDLTAQVVAFATRSASEPQKVSLTEEVDQTLRLFAATVHKSTSLVIEYAAKPQILAEKGRLHQVVLNLLTNAIHATRDTQAPRLRISVKTVPRPDDAPTLVRESYALLEVEDNGEGMSMETLQRAIDPFFTTKGPDEGSGMGLAIVHGIVSTAGGAVRLTSRVGRGSTVSVYWPTV